ncbi:hypothetical protein EDB89DRAFT_2072037 [Lactarius sanguifluus]|nr:hypothetical protein EDB89DRAFT_2072037 [Lactarius sanguifluus]
MSITVHNIAFLHTPDVNFHFEIGIGLLSLSGRIAPIVISPYVLITFQQKAVLWNVNAATPGMIAFAATLLLYACSPDDIFSDKSRGRSGIVWRERFTLYKRAIICFPDDYRTSLLAWYNEKLFGIVTASGAPSSSHAPEVGVEVVNSLVARLHQVNFKDLSEPSASPSTLMGLSTPEPDLPVSFPGQTQPTQVCAVPLDQVPSVLPPVGHTTSGDTPSIIPVEVPAPRATRKKTGKSKR